MGNLKTKTASALGTVTALVLGGWWLMGPAHSEHHWEDGHMMEFSSWGWLVMVFMILFWGLVVWAVIQLAGKATGNDGDGADSAIAIIKRRYAAGEITREEFEAKRRELL